MQVFTAPEPRSILYRPTIFLGGSIEEDKAEHWQIEILDVFKDRCVTFLNPRRHIWDNSWNQDFSNANFIEQVEWELDGLELADLIILYLQPGTISPVSLLELGLYAQSGKLVVCCPDGFFRKGNVDILCDRYGISTVGNKSELFNYINSFIEYKSCHLF